MGPVKKMSQDRRGLRSLEVERRGRKPQKRSTDLYEESSTSQVLRSSEGQRRRETVNTREGQGRRGGVEGRRGPVLKRAGDCRRRWSGAFRRAGELSPGAGGQTVPGVTNRFLRGLGRTRVRKGSGGFEDSRLGRYESLEGRKTRRVTATRPGLARGSANGLKEGSRLRSR